MSAWMDVAASATANRPSNGRGGVSTTAAGSYTTNDTVFTASGYTAAAGGTNGLANMAVGAVVATSDLFWGIVTSVAVGAIGIDRWRRWGFPNGNGVPAANADINCYPAFFGKNLERWIIESIEVTAAGGAGNIDIVDLFGATVLKRLTLAAASPPFVFNLTTPSPTMKEGDPGFEINGPFMVTTPAAVTVTVNFHILSDR